MKQLRMPLGFLCLAGVIAAHPMGNFSVNHYAGIQGAPKSVDIRYVLDLAEIPTFELLQQWKLQATSPGDFLSRTLHQGDIGWGLGLLCVAVAFGLGALHAFEPGHGKTMVAAYLVGSRGTVKHALFLGGMVTFTHTISVFILGFATLFLSHYVMPDKISKFLGVLSGLSIIWIGALLLYRRARSLSHPEHGHSHDHGHGHHHHPHGAHEHHHHDHSHHDHAHDHAHPHTHGAHTHTHDGHTHSHVPEGDVTLGSLIALGASGGLVPCPSALVLLLSAISIGRVGLGLLLLLGFSLGLAIVLMATGLAVLFAKNLLPERHKNPDNPFFRVLPVFSAAVIMCIGVVMTGVSLGIIPATRFLG